MVNQLYIDGVWTDGSDGRTWSVTIPATGDWLADVAVAAAEDVDRAARSLASHPGSIGRNFI